jgi:16S rRNA (adenine1518-N6/adenine1519-N6)-dimethyltransferase
MISDPRAVLASLERTAQKRFGQHFLARQDIVDAIVRTAGVRPGDKVVEVGPGLGILTASLVAAGAEVLALELDGALLDHLHRAVPGARVVHADATRAVWPELCAGSGWKLVANLPYNVGTGILMDAVRQPGTFCQATVMLQAEVIDRLAAPAGSDDFAALSVHLQARAAPWIAIEVPPSAFVPPPKVHSRVMRVDVFPTPQTGDAAPADFDRTVTAAFAQRRKMLRNTLKAAFGAERADAALEAAGIPGTHRAESLDLDGFRRLAAALFPRANA